jgi:hypothetical protein
MRVGLAAVVCAWLLLPGCGGDDESTTTDSAPPTTTSSTATSETPSPDQTQSTSPADREGYDASQPRGALEAVLTSGLPNLACDELVTEQFVRTAYGSAAACKASQLSGGVAKSIDIGSIQLEGSSATAKVVPDGGPSSGEKLTVSLVHDGDRWRLDAMRSNVPVGP